MTPTRSTLIPRFAHVARRTALVALAFAAACTESAPERPLIITNAHDISVCCDPEAELPLDVGYFDVQIYAGQLTDLDPESITPTLTTFFEGASPGSGPRHTAPNPLRLSVASGDPLEVGSNRVRVFVEDCNFTRIDVRFLVDVLGRRKSDGLMVAQGLTGQFAVVNTCPPTTPPPTPPQILVETILGATVEDFASFGVDAPTGVPVQNASSAVAPQVPPLDFTEAFQVGALFVDLTQEQLDAAFTGATPTFPLGQGELGYTMQAEYPVPMQPGRYLIAWQCVVGDVPLEVGVQYFQFGFVVDKDRDSGNNYRASAPFDTDPYDDTDTWFVMQADQFQGWRLAVSDATQLPPYPPDSAARGILDDQVQMWVIPVAELASPESILARFTTLVHEGDFGLTGGPWSGDVTPPIDEPRIPIALQ